MNFIVSTFLILNAFIILPIEAYEQVTHFELGTITVNIEGDNEQRSMYHYKAKELKQFLESELIPTIPNHIKRVLREHSLSIVFSSNIQSAAHFKSVENKESRYRVIEIPLTYLSGPKGLYSHLLAHEFYHYLHDIYRPLDAHWVKEGMAQLFQFQITGKHTMQNIAEGFQVISTPLIHNNPPPNMEASDYGHSALYFLYLRNNCFSNRFVWDYLLQQEHTGSEAIEKLLISTESEKAACQSFLDSVLYFEISRVYNKPYISSLNQINQYYIMNTVFSPIPELVSNRHSLHRRLNNLPPFTPLFVQLLKDQVASIQPISNMFTFYIQEKFPFQISNEPFNDEQQYVLYFKAIGSAD